VVAQHSFLGGRGEQAVPAHTNMLATTADIFREVKRHFVWPRGQGSRAAISDDRHVGFAQLADALG
jgi:hypothetical protein